MRADFPLALPEDPSLDGDAAVRAALLDAYGSMITTGAADLPQLVSQTARLGDATAEVSALVLARWLYRGWLETQADWRPFVHLDPSQCDDEGAIRESCLIAGGGWLFLDRGWESLDMRRIAQWCRERSVLLLRAGTRRLVVRPEVAARLVAIDRFHLVAVDPSMRELRRGLLSHCRSASVIHLAGPPGTGKRTLARWAHAVLARRPMNEFRRGHTAHGAAARWTMFEEVGELDADQQHLLRSRLMEGLIAPLPTPSEDGPRVPRPPHAAFSRIRGTSPALTAVLARAVRFAPSPLSVLVLGESGSGKELLARAVHDLSGRRGPYQVVDLSTLTEQLIESELFGHKRGAYTGADNDRLGAFRQADKGTLFLDEIGNLTPRIQAKLLRVLQEKTVQPVGADRPVPVDVRVICATNANLDGMVARGEFRADLLQRINAATLRLPPLRERPEDILPLAASFVADARGVPVERLPADWITERAVQVIAHHPWAGNVRELENVMRQAAAEAESSVIDERHLGPLAPENRRPVPLITTSSEPGSADRLPIERHLLQRMTAVTFNLPAVRDRLPGSVRSAVLGMLGGRPIRAEALDALERRAWWGNYHEIEMELAALRANLAGTVDVEAIERTLPYLLDRVGVEPIRVVLNPIQSPGGGIGGLQESFYGGALLIGRVSSTRELERAGLAEEATDADKARWAYLKRALGPSRADCLRLDHLHRLSRGHLLVTRTDEGLEVHALPGVRLGVSVVSLDDAGSSGTVRPGASRCIGRAGEIAIEGRGDRPYVRVFVFAGAVAFEEFSVVAARRANERSLADHTVSDTVATAGQRPLWTSGMWTLESFERELLNDIVLRYPGGDFKAHLEQELGPREKDPDFARLCGYILRNRPTLYCTRLYTHPTNDALRDELRVAIQASDQPNKRLDRLPVGIRRALEDLPVEEI